MVVGSTSMRDVDLVKGVLHFNGRELGSSTKIIMLMTLGPVHLKHQRIELGQRSSAMLFRYTQCG